MVPGKNPGGTGNGSSIGTILPGGTRGLAEGNAFEQAPGAQLARSTRGLRAGEARPYGLSSTREPIDDCNKMPARWIEGGFESQRSSPTRNLLESGRIPGIPHHAFEEIVVGLRGRLLNPRLLLDHAHDLSSRLQAEVRIQLIAAVQIGFDEH